MKRILLSSFILLVLSFSVFASEMPIIPEKVIAMYVILQKADDFSEGSSEVVATAVSPKEFLSEFQHYVNMAKSKSMKLVVTAETEDGNWVHGQIKYKGKRLRTTRYYDPGQNKVFSGSEIPLD